MSSSPRIVAAVSAVALLAGASSAASASAAVVSVNTGCVIFAGDYGAAAIPISGSGFTASSRVNLRTTTKSEPGPKYLATATTDASGSFATATGAAIFDSDTTRDQRFNLIASDDAQITALTSFRQVRAGYNRFPEPTQPRQRVKHIARGFTPGKTIWAHFRRYGKTHAHKRLGVARGPCGIATRKMRVLPVKRARLGTWKVFVDETKLFSLNTRPQARLTFRVIQPS